ncbi:MAG: TatD family hydrolase [Bacteroidia bacterium]|nr:TatD family hydrolase [Bacteroidia bacterium]
MILTDTHIHLYYPEYETPVNQLIAQAATRNVTRFFLPNVDVATIPMMYKVHEAHPNCTYMMMGLHPCSVTENYMQDLVLMENELNSGKLFCAIGEIGLDLYWDKTLLHEQLIAFEMQIKWALQRNIPFAIHCRKAFDEAYALLLKIKKEQKIEKFKGVFHCFSGTLDQAQLIIKLGFYLGIGGVVTYKNSGIQQVVEAIDLRHIVLETDAPYLAPVPYRGKTNMPVYLADIAAQIAFIKHITIDEVASITTQNSIDLFGV